MTTQRRFSLRSLATSMTNGGDEDMLDAEDVQFTEDANMARRSKQLVEDVRELVVRQRQKEKDEANKRLRCDYSWLQDSRTQVRQRNLSPKSMRVVNMACDTLTANECDTVMTQLIEKLHTITSSTEIVPLFDGIVRAVVESRAPVDLTLALETPQGRRHSERPAAGHNWWSWLVGGGSTSARVDPNDHDRPVVVEMSGGGAPVNYGVFEKAEMQGRKTSLSPFHKM